MPSRHRGFFFGRLQPELLPATMGCPQTTRSHRTLGPRMYKKIMVPVDLSHRERLEKAVATAADLSKCYKEIGRASCRERVCQYVEFMVGAVSLKKKKKKKRKDK